MKILEPGKIQEKWVIQHRCTAWGNGGKGCDALLEIELDDLRYFTESAISFLGEYEHSVCFKCPCCGKLTGLGLNDWPADYRRLRRWSIEWQDARPDSC